MLEDWGRRERRDSLRKVLILFLLQYTIYIDRFEREREERMTVKE